MSFHKRDNTGYSPKKDDHNAQTLKLCDDARTAILEFETEEGLKVIKDIYTQPDMKIDILLQNGWSGLMFAASEGKPELVLYFLERNANPNFHYQFSTALHHVSAAAINASKKYLECARYLVAHGADVNVLDRYNASPLIFATKVGNISLVKFLIKSGAKINQQDHCGMAAISHAAYNGDRLTVNILIDAKADLTILSSSGLSIPELCYSNNKNELGDVINRKIKSDPNLEDMINLKKLDLTSSKKRKDFENTESFLEFNNLISLIPKFAYHHITLNDLLHIDDEQLLKIGIKDKKERSQILNAVESTNKANAEAVEKKPLLKFHDLGKITESIVEHILLTEANVSMINRKLKAHPEILTFLKEVHTVKDLEDCVDAILKEDIAESFKMLQETFSRLEKTQEELPPVIEKKSAHWYEYIPSYFGVFFLLSGIVATWLALRKPLKFK